MKQEPLHVLAVDDDPSDGVLLQRTFDHIRGWDVELTVVRDGLEGLTKLTTGTFDVVLLDYQLGAEDGLTLLRAIRQSGYECPVIFLTGQGDEELAVEALRAGAADYLPKGALSPNSLERAVRNAVEKRGLQLLIQDHQDSLKRTNADLARRNREIQSFYHTLSHELKTPLTSAQEFLSLVLDEVAGPLAESQREYLEIVRDGIFRMNLHLDDLVDSTRVETGKLGIEARPCDAAPILRRVVQSLARSAGESGIELRLELEVEPLAATLDEGRFAQILLNLLTNALKFTPRGGRVVVRAREEGEELTVSVADTGRGIPPEHLALVFERLHQVENLDSTAKGGMGLGLHIVKGLVELHGGRISVQSTPGEGCTFTFTIPREPRSPSVADSEMAGTR